MPSINRHMFTTQYAQFQHKMYCSFEFEKVLLTTYAYCTLIFLDLNMKNWMHNMLEEQIAKTYGVSLSCLLVVN